MVAMLIGFLFFLATALALGTIIGMALTYRDKAMAALRMEHVPASPLARGPSHCYSPARQARFATAPTPRRAAAFRAHAA